METQRGPIPGLDQFVLGLQQIGIASPAIAAAVIAVASIWRGFTGRQVNLGEYADLIEEQVAENDTEGKANAAHFRDLISRAMLILVLLLVGSSVVSAQQTGPCPTDMGVVANPTTLCFEASPDHNATELEGLPKIERYDLLYFAPGVNPTTGAPTQVVNIGKPTPNAQNAVWMTRAELGTLPVGQTYRIAMVAVGPSGTSVRSSASNPFGRTSATPPVAPGRSAVVRP